MLTYRDYIGTVEFDPETHELFGKVVNADMLLMYSGPSVEVLEQRMREAIDNYLALCEEQGVKAHKPFSGKYALRMDPVLHARLAAAAEETGQSINTIIVEAARQAVSVHAVADSLASAAAGYIESRDPLRPR